MDNQLNIRDYVDIVRRRFWLLVLPFLLVAAVSSGIVMGLPAIYRSTAVILVESQQIPQDLVQSTITAFADERIATIRQRVMTRANLMGIIDTYALFADVRATASTDDLLDLMRSQIYLELITPELLRQRREATVAFELSFEGKDPELAAAVAEELATLFLAENVKSRTERASETTAFLEQEAKKLREYLDEIESRVASYKQEHGDALPEHLEMRIAMLERAEAELQALDRDLGAIEGEKSLLEVDIVSGASLAEGRAGDAVLSPAQQLAALKTTFIEKSAIYGAAHPDVRALKRQIAALEKEVDTPRLRVNFFEELESARSELVLAKENHSAEHPSIKRLETKIAALEREIEAQASTNSQLTSASYDSDPAIALLQARVAAAEYRIRSLQDEKMKVRARIEDLQAKIIETPQIERELVALNRDYENAMTKYEDVKAKQLDAQLAERLEEEQKAERFVLLESPTVPIEPVSPERGKLLMMGLFLALGAGGGAAFSAEMLDNTLHAPALLATLVGTHPLAVIPYIETSSERRSRKRRKRLLLALTALIVLLATVLVHQFIIPLDVLVTPALEESGTQ